MRRPLFEQRIRQLGPINSHEIAGQHGAQGCHVAAGAAIAHDADGLERQEGGEGIAGEVVSVFAAVGDGKAQLFNGDGVSLAQQGGVFAHTQA